MLPTLAGGFGVGGIAQTTSCFKLLQTEATEKVLLKANLSPNGYGVLLSAVGCC